MPCLLCHPVINGGYAHPVTLTLSGAPSEAYVSIELNPVIPPGASHLPITTTECTAAGADAMSVIGTSGPCTDTANLILNVSAAIPNFAFKSYFPV